MEHKIEYSFENEDHTFFKIVYTVNEDKSTPPHDHPDIPQNIKQTTIELKEIIKVEVSFFGAKLDITQKFIQMGYGSRDELQAALEKHAFEYLEL